MAQQHAPGARAPGGRRARRPGLAAAGAPFDVAILDAQMPEGSGVDLARAIRAEPTLAGPRLVLLTPPGEGGPGAAPPHRKTLDFPLARCDFCLWWDRMAARDLDRPGPDPAGPPQSVPAPVSRRLLPFRGIQPSAFRRPPFRPRGQVSR